MKITFHALTKAFAIRIYTSKTSRYEVYVSLRRCGVHKEIYEYTNHRGREVWVS